MDHDVVSKENMEKMKHAYANQATVLNDWVDGRHGRVAANPTVATVAASATDSGNKRKRNTVALNSEEEDEDEDEDTNVVAIGGPRSTNKKPKL